MDHGEGKKRICSRIGRGLVLQVLSKGSDGRGFQLNCPSDRKGGKTTLLGWASNIIFTFGIIYREVGDGNVHKKRRTRVNNSPPLLAV